MSHRLCLMALMLLVAGPAQAGQGALSLAREGRTEYVIVKGQSPTEAEAFAAEELAACLGRITGATFRVLGETDALPDAKRVFVGQTEFAGRQGVEFGRLGKEEWVLRTVGSDLLIAGGRPRGTLYGVYALLEGQMGCHWLDESTEVVPKNPDLALKPLRLSGKPAFAVRAISGGYYSIDSGLYSKDQLYRVRNRVNGSGSGGLGAKFGFSVNYGSPGGCHTFGDYAREFPTDHPEYLSMNAQGKRIGAKDGSGPGGICLMHPEVRKLVLARLREYIKRDRESAAKAGTPPPLIYDISQNDNHWMCQCPECKAMSQREGSESGPVVDFINAIADGIRAEYPDVQVMTFAYSITEIPPKTLKPRDNVIIRIAELNAEWGRESDLFHPITHKTNAGQLKRLQGWGRIARNISQWDYWIQYSPNDKFPTPYAPIDCIPVDLRTFHRNGVNSIYVECEDTERTSFYALKRWLGFQLMIDPKQPAEPLLRTFFDGYYGPASGKMREYLKFVQRSIAAVNVNLSALENYDRPYLTLDFYLTCGRLLEEAEALCAGDEKALLHVRRERPPVDAGLYCMWEQCTARAPGRQIPFTRESLLERYRTYRLEQMAAFRPAAALAKGKEDLARETKGMGEMQVVEQRRKERPPVVRVPRAESAQGDPRKPDWSKAADLAPWFTAGGRDTDQKVRAAVLHDGRCLYLKLEHLCDPAKLVTGEEVWSGDDWELFFAPRRQPPYRQLAVGVKGQSIAFAWEKLIGQCKPAGWQSGARVACETRPDRWTAFVSLPLENLVPGGVQPGGVFYANLCRSVAPPSQLFLTWSPNFDESFHVLTRLGEFRLEP